MKTVCILLVKLIYKGAQRFFYLTTIQDLGLPSLALASSPRMKIFFQQFLKNSRKMNN